jgi:hypothetical protein
MSTAWNDGEQAILEALDAALHGPAVASAIEAIAARVEQKLSDDPEAKLAWETVPLETYGGGLPEEILSSWVFVLRAGITSGAERHPNSRQRMMSWRGRGDFQIWARDAWQTNVLVSDTAAPLDERWISIPVNVWHKPVMSAENWVVVSFHTVPAEELIEETGGPQAQSTHRRIYVPGPGAHSPGVR